MVPEGGEGAESGRDAARSDSVAPNGPSRRRCRSSPKPSWKWRTAWQQTLCRLHTRGPNGGRREETAKPELPTEPRARSPRRQRPGPRAARCSADGARTALRPERATCWAGHGPHRSSAPDPSAHSWSTKFRRGAPPPTRQSRRRRSGPGPAQVPPRARACARADPGPRPTVSALCRAPWPLLLPRRRRCRPSWPRPPGSRALGAAGCPRWLRTGPPARLGPHATRLWRGPG